MVLGSRRRHYLIFIAITGILYLVAICLYISTIPEGQRSADLINSRFVFLTLYDNEASKIVNKRIDEFESSYVTIFPPNYHEKGKDGRGVKNYLGEVELQDRMFKKHSFNEQASSKIGFERSIPDNRPEE